jgi:hypothetical protein
MSRQFPEKDMTMTNPTIAVLRAHLAEIDRLRRCGDVEAADALLAAVNAWREQMERAQGRRLVEGE